MKMPLYCLLSSNTKQRVSVDEHENKQRRSDEQTSLALQIMGFVLCGSLSIVGVVLANVLAARKVTEETHQVMYTVALAFAWDFFVVQVIYGLVQMCLIRSWKAKQLVSERIEEPTGITAILMNRDISRIV